MLSVLRRFCVKNKYTHANFRALFMVQNKENENIMGIYTCIYLWLQFVTEHELYTKRALGVRWFTNVGIHLFWLGAYFIKSLNRNICQNSFDSLEIWRTFVIFAFLSHFYRQHWPEFAWNRKSRDYRVMDRDGNFCMYAVIDCDCS